MPGWADGVGKSQCAKALICYCSACAKGRLSGLSLGDLSWVSPDLLDGKAKLQFLFRVTQAL